MKKILLAFVVILSVLALAVLPGCYQGPQGPGVSVPSISGISLNSQQVGLWVNGTGKVPAVPDVAILSLGVQAQSPAVADAQAKAVDGMNGVMAALTGNGVAQKDIQTQSFNVQQLTRYDQPTQQNVVVGYQVTNTVVAKVRALDKVGVIIDAVVKAGGDLTRINSISFTVDDPTAFTNQARQLAMADAKAKADQMAKLAGVTLGKATLITESSYQPPVPSPIFQGGVAAAAPSTPISPGELQITVNVQVAYAIQ